MSLEVTTIEPSKADFTTLSAHQERTPDTFHGATPVLHLHSRNALLNVSYADIVSQPALQHITPESATSAQDTVDVRVDVWVTSKNLTFFALGGGRGVIVPYQAIVVHAAEGEEVLLGLNLSDANTLDEDMTFIQLRITPEGSRRASGKGGADGEAQLTNGAGPASGQDLALFNAISACQELNPDPPQEGDEKEGGFDETAPGATGRITSENMADFMDENGELKMPEGVTVYGDEGADGANGLGEGAGRTRSAAELDGGDAEGGGEEETKWQRTD